MLNAQHALTSGSVTSRDGTRIGYLQTGHGPAVVLLHGSMETARSRLLLAEALADRFTVHLPSAMIRTGSREKVAEVAHLVGEFFAATGG